MSNRSHTLTLAKYDIVLLTQTRVSTRHIFKDIVCFRNSSVYPIGDFGSMIDTVKAFAKMNFFKRFI